MQDRRRARFESLLKEEISNIISREVKNPNVGMVTITRVEVTPDYTKAKVYFSVIPSMFYSLTRQSFRGTSFAEDVYQKG